MTSQTVDFDDRVVTHPEMTKLIIDAMTTTRANIDRLCQDSGFTKSVAEAANVLIGALRTGKRVLVCGNGGSMSDAMHFAEELTGNFRSHRQPLGAIALSDSAHLTCVANDFGYEQVFARGVEAHGRPGDVLIGISTSGESPNVLAAVSSATDLGMWTIGIIGRTQSRLAEAVDFAVVTDVESKWADRVQELHIIVIHMLVELIEAGLFGTNSGA